MEPTIDRAVTAVVDGSFEPADYGPFSFMSYGGGSFIVDEAWPTLKPSRLPRRRNRKSWTASSASM